MKAIKMLAGVFMVLILGNPAISQEKMELDELAIRTSTYHTAIGLRAGETSGLTIRQFIGQKSALEGIVGVWYHGLSATVLYERFAPAFETNGLNWYYGIGGHVSFQTNRTYFYSRNNRYERYSVNSLGLGIDGIFGLEYKLSNAPIAIGLDLKPYAEIISSGDLWMSLDPGIEFRVTF